MNKDIEKIEEKIKDVIRKNEDAVKGFEKAAENAKTEGIQSYFRNKAIERTRYIKTLRNATPALEIGDPDGSTAGNLHRTWMDVKAFFSRDNDEVMLEEAIKGDRSAIEEYNEVLAESQVPHRVKEILREQRDAIRNDLETSVILEDYR
jgi:uncharacterized protein (TIGR02284 family)